MKPQVRFGLIVVAALAVVAAAPGVSSAVDVSQVQAQSATFGSLDLSVQVERTYCEHIGTQCIINGVPAADGNRNPVRVALQVLKETTPVDMLPSAAFTVVNPFTPPGAMTVTRTACSTCFGGAGNGLYVIFVNPLGTATWRSGSYHVQFRVNLGGVMHRALAQIEIP